MSASELSYFLQNLIGSVASSFNQLFVFQVIITMICASWGIRFFFQIKRKLIG